MGLSSAWPWVTMISPTYFISADHYHPGGGSTVTFWEGNSKADPSKGHTYVVDSWGYRATDLGSGCDVWVGRLTQPLAPARCAQCNDVQEAFWMLWQ